VRLTVRLLVTLALFVLATATAQAQSCSFSISDVNFGNVDFVAGGAVDTTATLQISCSGVPLTGVRVCPSIGAGSGGATAASRQMPGPAGALNYQLYQDAGRTVVWGSYQWGFAATPPTIDVNFDLSGNGSASQTIYARLFAGQSTAPAGAYLSAFSAADVQIAYATLGILGCNALLLPQFAHPTFAARATIVNNCLVAAQDIDFGVHGVLATAVDADGGVSVTCTPSAAYAIGLSGGNADAAPTARKMARGADSITYGLYQDAARGRPWGDSVPANTLAGTGSGLAQTFTVYGRVPAQPTPAPGTYTDRVVVTVTY
jgi:spore coat protein U-like protein